jgi:hypothetical protein
MLPRLAASLGSSRLSTVPRLLMLTPLPRPPSKPEALGLVGTAPLTPLAGAPDEAAPLVEGPVPVSFPPGSPSPLTGAEAALNA